MTNRISDRKLERLALGEIPADEANELLKVLEDRGELHRFEDLLADNEAFAEDHPSGLLAARVREELRRSQRNSEEDMVSSRTPFVPIAAAVAALIFISGTWWLSAGPTPVQTTTSPQAAASVSQPAPRVLPPADPRDLDRFHEELVIMSPEQAKSQPLDSRTDVFLLGVAAFEMLKGEPLFEGRSRAVLADRLRAWNVDELTIVELPPGWAPILRRALASSPEERFANPAEMMQVIGSTVGPRRDWRFVEDVTLRDLSRVDLSPDEAAWAISRLAQAMSAFGDLGVLRRSSVRFIARSGDVQLDGHLPTPSHVVSEPVLRKRGETFPIPETVYASVGTIVEFDTSLVSRVEIGNEDVAVAMGSESVLYLEAAKAGNSVIKFWKQPGGEPVVWKSFLFTVGAEIPSEELMPFAEGKPSLLDCAEKADGREIAADVTIVVAGDGAVVGNLFIRGGAEAKRDWDDNALRQCVEERIHGWRMTNDGELTVGRLSFNFAAGAVCQPGEDC